MTAQSNVIPRRILRAVAVRYPNGRQREQLADQIEIATHTQTLSWRSFAADQRQLREPVPAPANSFGTPLADALAAHFHRINPVK